jgi:tetratricopeptide (TPR) repeat protein
MRSRHAILLSSLLICGIVYCGAQSKASEKPTTLPDYSKEAYVVEHLSTSITVEDDGSDVREVTAEVKLLADAGVKALAVLNFTYTSANQVVDVDYVRVRKPDGSVVKTPDYNIQDMPAEVTRTAPLYSDVHEKHVAVKALGVGDVLEYKIRFRILKPQVPGQFWYEHSFDKNEIVRDERLELSVPKAKHLTVKSPDFKPEIKEEGARKIYSWKYSYLVRSDEEEPATPPRTLPPPSVQISTFSSWQEIGRWYSELQKEQVAVTPAIAAKAKELTANLSTDDEKLRAIYKFVSVRFHYVGLDFGIGRYQPHAAEDVLGNEYGDCKDKHTLFASLLKAAGFEAWPVLIHASRKLDPEVPSLAQFNHVITVVSLGNKLIWLDTTPEVAPYELLLPTLRDKQALVMPPDKAAYLLTTPANSPFAQTQHFTTTAKLGADGVLKGHIEQRYRGDSEVVFRTLLRQTPQASWKELIQRLSYSLGFGGEVSNIEASPVEDLGQPFVLSYDYLRKDYADWENRQILAALPPFGIEFAGNKNQKTPKEPVYLGSPSELIYHSQIELPPGSSLVPPTNLNLVEPYLEYHSVNALENGTLKTTRRLVLKKTEVPVSEWEGFRKLAKSVSDDEFNYVHLSGLPDDSAGGMIHTGDLDRKFRDGVDALQRHDNRRAQEIFEQVIAADPKYRGAHFNLGAAYAGQNRMEDALAEFRKEVEIAPTDTQAVQAAANMSMLLGHNEDEIQEWSRLLKLDPQNREAAVNLGQILSRLGKYAEAVEILEPAVQSAPDSPILQYLLGQADLHVGKADQALAHLRIAADENTKSVDVSKLNDIAYTLADADIGLDFARQFAEKALAELDSQSRAAGSHGDPKILRTYAPLWDTAGWVYFKLGDYKRAESYIRAAWLLQQRAVVGEHLGEVYEKLNMPKEAAHAYSLAYSGVDLPKFIPIGRPSPEWVMKGYEETRTRIAERYKKLTGKTLEGHTFAIQRLPNGQWPLTPTEELSRIRELKLGKIPGLLGSAGFDLAFSSGGPTAVVFESGDAKMKAISAKLAAAKFQVAVPADSKGILVRHVTVYCGQYAGCDAVLAPLE